MMVSAMSLPGVDRDSGQHLQSRAWRWPVPALAALAVAASAAGASPPAADSGERLFVERIAPILETRCLRCHGDRIRRRGFSLATRADLLTGGRGGPAAVSGRPDRSLLVRMVSGAKPRMPKASPALSAEEVSDLKRWVEEGLLWPTSRRLASRDPKAGWAFRPIVRPAVPTGRGRTQANPVDAFLSSRLRRKGLPFNPEADRRTLIRRLTYDLHGLPPTPEEIDAFANDRSPGAYEALVDRLLASPRYGERFARHWLDVAHFADTHGMARDLRRDNAWPYRDYVVRSFNEDKGYGRFVKEQIAGDLIAPETADGVVATAFLAAGPYDYAARHGNGGDESLEKQKARSLDRDDMVASTTSTFLSVTVACARCHDHKIDPIPQRDYYKLQAVFAGLDRGDRPYANLEVARRHIAIDERLELLMSLRRDAVKRPADEQRDAEIARVDAERRQLESAISSLPPHGLVFTVKASNPWAIRVLRRGDIEAPEDEVPPGALCAIPALPCAFPREDPEDEGPARLALADWIASNGNPLTWRSIVNRVWQWHFGRGLVETPNDFGGAGARPSHPELLDWLAAEFRDGGGSFKRLSRLLVLSRAYRQSSTRRADGQRLDAENRLLWRANRKRLDAEAVRDSILSASGRLDLTPGGPAFEAFRYVDQFEPTYDYSAPGSSDKAGTFRRALYRFVPRGVPDPFLAALDCADPNVSTPVRRTTGTATQALALANDPFVLRQSEQLAARVSAMAAPLAAQVQTAVLLALGRAPSKAEAQALAAHAARHGLASMCRVLFNTNEFLFID
jgi:mono/diheme cytochrome c family protein